MATEKQDAARVRFQLTLCLKVAALVEKHAREMQRSQAWLCCWAIRVTLDEPGNFAKWLTKRLKAPKRHQAWAETQEDEPETRLQLRMSAETLADLESTATALNQSPIRLAGLMVNHALEQYPLVLKFMKSGMGKFMRRVVRGSEDERIADDEG